MELLAILAVGGLIGAALAAYASVRFGPSLQKLVPAPWLRSASAAMGIEYRPTWRGLERLIVKRMVPVLGLDGVRTVPVRYDVRLAPEDYAVAGDRVALMELELVKALRRRAYAQQWHWAATPEVRISADPAVVEGFPEVSHHLDSGGERGPRRQEPAPRPEARESAPEESPIIGASAPSSGTTVLSPERRVEPTVRAVVFTLTLESPEGDSHPLAFIDGDEEVLVGRHPDSDVVLDSRYVSAHHARIQYDPEIGEARVEDLGSTNGTLVGGRVIVDSSALPLGVRVQFGRGGPEFVVRRRP